MSILINVRRFIRPDQPQPVHAQAVDATVRAWAPIWWQALNSNRTDGRRALDVRGNEWAPDDGWIPRVTDTVIQQWGPVFQHVLRAERTTGRAVMDGRWMDWSPGPGWMVSSFTQSVSVAQMWPAFLEAMGLSYRSAASPWLDVRTSGAPGEGWQARVVDGVVRQWSPVFDAERSARTGDRVALDLRGADWAPSLAWIFTSLTGAGPTIAQIWPAILHAVGLSYRSVDRARLDVRSHEWLPEQGWLQPVVDGIVRSWTPIWAAQAASVRSVEARRLDVRAHEWASLAWIFSSLTPAITAAQMWPAFLQALSGYRSGEQSRFDVHGHDWSAGPAWLFRSADAVVRTWAPIFLDGRSYRTEPSPRLDVRRYDWAPEPAWLARVVEAYVSTWAPIWNTQTRSVRSDAGAVLDPRFLSLIASIYPITAAELDAAGIILVAGERWVVAVSAEPRIIIVPAEPWILKPEDQ